MSSSTSSQLSVGIRAALPAGLGIFPLGIALGVLVLQAGLPWWMAPALSTAVFAGSMELLMVNLLTAGVSVPGIALTTLLVNFRHVFYAFSFPLHVVRHPVARAYSVYALIDEAFATVVAKKRPWTQTSLLTMQVSLQVMWLAGSLLGVAVGALIPMQIQGIEFALCALFICLCLDAARTRGAVPSLLLAAVSFSVAVVLFPGQLIFAAMLTFVLLLLVRFGWQRWRGTLGPVAEQVQR